MSQPKNQTSGRLPVSAGLILGLLCFLWGAQAVSIRFSNQGRVGLRGWGALCGEPMKAEPAQNQPAVCKFNLL